MAQTLSDSVAGDASAQERMLELLYDELRALAGSFMRGERDNHTLQATALVHEAYFRMIPQDRVELTGKQHFMRLAAMTMRRILIDHSKKHGARVQGKLNRAETVDEASAIEWSDPTQLLAIHELLDELSASNPRQAEVFQMKFFGGLTLSEIGEAMDLSHHTMRDDWRFATAWFKRRLAQIDDATDS